MTTACLGLLLGLALAVRPAWSQAPSASLPVLGETISAGASAQLRAQVRAIAQSGARVEEIRLEPGSVVRVYVSSAGRVFGLAWQSPTLPDLKHLLGSHFAAFQAAAARTQRRGPLYVHTGTLVVELSGHMRDFRGRAYLTDAIPATLTPAVVR